MKNNTTFLTHKERKELRRKVEEARKTNPTPFAKALSKNKSEKTDSE